MDHDNFISRSQSFLHWLKQHGTTVSPKIELADLRSRNAGRGVVATADIAEDEELFNIPRTSILTAENSSIPTELQVPNDPWLSLIVAMIYEYQQGNGSEWKPYFDVLPEHFDTLMFWSDEELAALEGSAVVSKIGKKSANEAFRTHIIPKLQQDPKAFNFDELTTEALYSMCHRMGSTIMAYAFDMEKPGEAPGGSKSEEDGWEEDEDETETLPKGMVPLADMLNADAERNNAKLFYEEDKVVMKTIRAVGKGEELFNDYGPLPNADVLRRYGYVTSNYDQYDVVEISLEIVKAAARSMLQMSDGDFDARLHYLDEQGVLDDGYDIAHPSNEDGQFPEELCIMLNTVTLPKTDFEKLQQKQKLPKPDLSQEAVRLLKIICLARRTRYMNDDGEDVTMSGSADASNKLTRREMAQHVVRGEKVVLQEAADVLDGMAGDTNKKRKADTPEHEASEVRKVKARVQKG